MKEINTADYSSSFVYSVDQVLAKIKSVIGQYVSGLKINVTAEQFSVLNTICKNENICQQDVVQILSKDKSNVKRIVEILEKKHFITKTLGKRKNRTVNYLAATKFGRELINNNEEKIRNYISGMFDGISREELSVFKKVIAKLDKKKPSKKI